MLNREQAQHILDAYVKAKDKDAKDSLREVILDAMTAKGYIDYPYYPYYRGWTWTDNDGTKPTITKPIVTFTGAGTDDTTISNGGDPASTTTYATSGYITFVGDEDYDGDEDEENKGWRNLPNKECWTCGWYSGNGDCAKSHHAACGDWVSTD